MGIIESPIFWIVLAAASEIIALTPLKSNSVVQLVFSALDSIKPKKPQMDQKRKSQKMVSGCGDLILAALKNGFVE